MQQQLFPKAAWENKKMQLGSGLELEITEGFKPKAKLYRSGLLIKIVELSDRVAKRILVVEAIELGATQTYLRCPECGFSLKIHCPHCSRIVDNGWQFCPHCKEQISRESPV
jgi:uncharacterized protein with PIN domain